MRKLGISYENPIDNFLYSFIEIMAPYMYKYNIYPNMITTMGTICWIYGAFILYNNNNYIFSAILFAVSYYFDCLDGYVARKYNQQTLIGDYFDHISDTLKGLCYLMIFYVLNSTLFYILFPFILIGLFLSTLHMTYQEKIHNKKDDSPTLAMLNSLIPGHLFTKNKDKLKQRLKITRYFGTGTTNFFMTIFVILFGHNRKK